MAQKPLTLHQIRTWKELVYLIKARLRTKSRKTILYGDLAERIFGSRRKGAQSFGHSLYEIHVRTDAFNRAHGTHHPRINSLVFNQRDTQPGIPAHQDPQMVWSILEKNGSAYLDRLAI